MENQWEGRLVLKHGFRKHILFWSIPADLREPYGLKDGMTANIAIDIDGQINMFSARLFGGYEFKVPEDLRNSLVEHQLRRGSVRFQLLDFADPNSDAFQVQVRRLSSLSDSEMRERLPRLGNLPEKAALVRNAFIRSRVLVAYALRRSDGRCEACGKEPFRRFKGGEVYLEVHHIVALAMGGFDSEENVMALCPECHRFAHFGDPKEWGKVLKTFFMKTNLPDPRSQVNTL
jgi:hypothetical protein